MPGPQRDALYDAESAARKNCDGLHLCLAINYGGRAELVPRREKPCGPKRWRGA